MEIKFLDYLHDDCEYIRTKVFIDEQKFKKEIELDDRDNHCYYIIIYENNQPVATCRYFELSDNIYTMGRVAVLAEHRGKGFGKQLVISTEEHIKKLGGKVILLSSQMTAQKFYESLGYISEGETYFEEHCEHIKMRKILQV